MSTETPGSLPGPHSDRSGDGARSPAAWDAARDLGGGRVRAYYSDAIRLPGFGTQPERCVPRKPVGFCDAAGHVTLAAASPCETRGCPEHWSLWQQSAAVAMVARLAAYRYVQQGAEKRLLHVVDSPDPERRWTAEAFWEGRGESYDAVRAVGGRGGVTLPHPYRTSEAGDWLFESAVEAGDWEEEWGQWSLLRRTADDWEEMGEFVEPGPHYHHLVAAEDFDPAGVNGRRAVKNIRSLDRFRIRDMTGYRDMARLSIYLLSHAPFQPSANRNTVTYWGEVHPNSFNPEEELTASEWDTIQRMAKRAVTTRPSDDLGGLGQGQEADRSPCPHEGCEGQVVPLDELREWLSRGEWVASISRRQRLILSGVQGWVENQGDRPPPSSNEAAIREWLYQWGRTRMQMRQSGLSSFV